MKRIMLIVLALLMALTAFSACKGSTSGDASGKVTVKLGIWPQDTDEAGIELYKDYVKQFNEKYPDVTIEAAHYEYAVDSFVPMYEAKTIPTIFETWYTEPGKLISGKYVKDITDIVKDKGWDMVASVKGLISDDQGHLYGMPRDGYVLGIHCNVELFKEAGYYDEKADKIKAPKTWEELAKMAQDIKKKTGAGICILAKDNAGGWHFTNIAWCFGATFQKQDKDGFWECDLNSKEAVAAMQFMSDLKWKYDCINDDPTSAEWATGFEEIATNKSAMYIGATDAVDQYGFAKGMEPDNLAVIPIPKGPSGKSISLLAGTPLMFPSYVSDDEAKATLNFLAVIGKVPSTDDQTKANIKKDNENKFSKGVPNVPNFNAWIDEDYNKLLDDMRKDYINVNMNNFQDYYDNWNNEGALRTEEPKETQLMYQELNKVLSEVLTKKDANIQKLLDNADKNFQKILDEKVNKDIASSAQ